MARDGKQRHIDKDVGKAVDHLSKQGLSAVVIAVDKNGYYSQQSNVSRSLAGFLLNYACRKFMEKVEAERGRTTNQNDQSRG